jgi:ribose transport system substrate-binding protein
MKRKFFDLAVFLFVFALTITVCGHLYGGIACAATAAGGVLQITPAMQQSGPEDVIGDTEKYKGLTIGFSQRNIAGSEWYEQLIRVAKMEAKHLGVNLVVLDAQSDLAKQASDIENLLSQSVDAIILNPQDSSGVLPAVNKIHAAKIPLIVVNSALDPSGAPFSFVSTNAFNTGYKSGFALAEAVDKKWGWRDVIKAAVLSANPQELESDQRRWGQLAGYEDYMLQHYGKSNLNIQYFDYYKWLPDVAMLKTEDMIQSNPDIDVIFSACDGGAQGIIPALKSAGKEGEILICSIDARKTVLQWIKDGNKGIVCSVSNDPRMMGKWGVLFAAAAASGETVPSNFFVPNPAITQQNINDYFDPNSQY